MLLRGLRFVPRIQVTDKLASYGVAHRRLTQRGASWIEVSEQPGPRTPTNPRGSENAR
jgi:hypothetical protein